MADIESRLRSLDERVRRAEDELAIRNAVVRYGVAIDIGDAVGTADTFTDDTEYDIGPLATGDGTPVVIHGRDGIINDLVLGEGHQRLLPNCAHTIGPFMVRVEGDTAVAAGYSRIYHRDDKGGDNDRFTLFRIGLNQWRLTRDTSGEWRVAHRSSRILGNEGAQDHLAEGLERSGPQS